MITKIIKAGIIFGIFCETISLIGKGHLSTVATSMLIFAACGVFSVIVAITIVDKKFFSY